MVAAGLILGLVILEILGFRWMGKLDAFLEENENRQKQDEYDEKENGEKVSEDMD